MALLERPVGPTAPVGPPPPRRSVPTWLLAGLALLGAAVLVGVLVTALLVGGGRPAPATAGLPSAGPVTGWALPVAVLAVRLASVALVGLLCFTALLQPATRSPSVAADQARALAVRLARWVVVAWLAAETARLVLLTSSLLGVPVTSLTPDALRGVATAVAPGRAALVTVALLLVVLAGLLLRPALARRPAVVGGDLLLLLGALAALLSPVLLAGHSAGSGDHALAVSSLAVHVVTAAVWVGGLGALLVLGRGLDEPVVAVRRFSALALGCVLLLGLTGVVSAAVLTGSESPSDLLAVLGTGYGALLLAKTAALVVLAGAGAAHRRWTLPSLAAGRRGSFVRLGAVEVGLMAATVAVAVGLAASPPPAAGGGASVLVAVPVPVAAAPGAPAPDASGPDAPGAAGPGAAGPGAADLGAAGPVAADPGTGATAVEDAPFESMEGHDHGELSVGVLIDDERFHVGRAVRAGTPVTVFNSGAVAVSITAEDGSFDVEVPPRTFTTFTAPAAVGDHAFASRHDAAFSDVLRVLPADG